MSAAALPARLPACALRAQGGRAVRSQARQQLLKEMPPGARLQRWNFGPSDKGPIAVIQEHLPDNKGTITSAQRVEIHNRFICLARTRGRSRSAERDLTIVGRLGNLMDAYNACWHLIRFGVLPADIDESDVCPQQLPKQQPAPTQQQPQQATVSVDDVKQRAEAALANAAQRRHQQQEGELHPESAETTKTALAPRQPPFPPPGFWPTQAEAHIPEYDSWDVEDNSVHEVGAL